MKTKPWVAVPATVFALLGLLAPHVSAEVKTYLDGVTSELSANPKIIKNGEFPTLTWKIQHPKPVKERLEPGKIKPLTPLYADIRIIGQGVTAGTNYVPTRATLKLDGVTKDIFKGINSQIDANAVVKLKDKGFSATLYPNNLIPKGVEMIFGGQYDGKVGSTSYKGTFYEWGPGQDNVRFLFAGEKPPKNVPADNIPSLESFLKPYLDSTGKVKIGPMDVIVFMELTHNSSQKSDPGYDLQDLVLLVTFREP